MVEQDTGFDAAYRRVCSADRAFEGLRLCISVQLATAPALRHGLAGLPQARASVALPESGRAQQY